MLRIALATVMVALVVPAAAVALDREPLMGGKDRSLGLSLEQVNGKVKKVEKVNARRGGINGLKRKLNSLIDAHNALVTSHNQLVTSFTNLQTAYNSTVATITTCFLTRNVTQYDGYDYNGSIGATTALDFTEPGDFPSARMMVFGC